MERGDDPRHLYHANAGGMPAQLLHSKPPVERVTVCICVGRGGGTDDGGRGERNPEAGSGLAGQ